MKTINLREYYPFYTSDFFIEVPDEVERVFITFKQQEAASHRRKYYNKAQYSLDSDDGIERHLLNTEPSAEEVYVRELTRKRVLTAIAALPDKQGQRIYARYFLGVSKSDIAKADGVTERAVTISIRRGLRHIEKILKKFF